MSRFISNPARESVQPVTWSDPEMSTEEKRPLHQSAVHSEPLKEQPNTRDHFPTGWTGSVS